MCPGAWDINTSGDKVKSSPVDQRPRSVTEFINNMNNNITNTYLNDINAILTILKATSLLPIYERISKYELGPPTKVHTICSYAIQTLLHAITMFFLYGLFSGASEQLVFSFLDTENINYWLENLLCVISYSMILHRSFVNSETSLEVLNILLDVDDGKSRYSSDIIHNNCGFANASIAAIVVLQLYMIILKIVAIEETIQVMSYFVIVLYSFLNGLTAMFAIYASVLMRLMEVRIEYANSILLRFTYKEQRPKVGHHVRRLDNALSHPTPMEDFPDDSHFALLTYSKCLRAHSIINEDYCLTLAMYMGYAFYAITTNSYNLFVQLVQREVSSYFLQICFVVLIHHTIILTLVTRCCGHTGDQANETKELLSRVYTKNENYQDILDRFLTKSIKFELQFSAYGFFIIDKSTLFYICAGVTTYLVILLQFQQLEDTKDDDE